MSRSLGERREREGGARGGVGEIEIEPHSLSHQDPLVTEPARATRSDQVQGLGGRRYLFDLFGGLRDLVLVPPLFGGLRVTLLSFWSSLLEPSAASFRENSLRSSGWPALARALMLSSMCATSGQRAITSGRSGSLSGGRRREFASVNPLKVHYGLYGLDDSPSDIRPAVIEVPAHDPAYRGLVYARLIGEILLGHHLLSFDLLTQDPIDFKVWQDRESRHGCIQASVWVSREKAAPGQVLALLKGPRHPGKRSGRKPVRKWAFLPSKNEGKIPALPFPMMVSL